MHNTITASVIILSAGVFEWLVG